MKYYTITWFMCGAIFSHTYTTLEEMDSFISEYTDVLKYYTIEVAA